MRPNTDARVWIYIDISIKGSRVGLHTHAHKIFGVAFMGICVAALTNSKDNHTTSFLILHCALETSYFYSPGPRKHTSPLKRSWSLGAGGRILVVVPSTCKHASVKRSGEHVSSFLPNGEHMPRLPISVPE